MAPMSGEHPSRYRSLALEEITFAFSNKVVQSEDGKADTLSLD